MDPVLRIEQALERALAQGMPKHQTNGQACECPPRLDAAIRYAMFPGGARVRPRLCLAVAAACGDDDPGVTDSAAAAIEILHCASLIHDDLPCFDDAPVRRGKPSVHRAFEERLAVLAGDGMIVLAFQTLARGACHVPDRLCALISTVGGAVGMPAGIIAGQAWECESQVVLADYQRAKTGALFAGATMAGAAAAGTDPGPWRALGQRLGEAYQVADDLLDVTADPEELGKPTGRDAALSRPSAVRELGVDGSSDRLHQLVADAVSAIPDCPGQELLREVIKTETRRFLNNALGRRAAA